MIVPKPAGDCDSAEGASGLARCLCGLPSGGLNLNCLETATTSGASDAASSSPYEPRRLFKMPWGSKRRLLRPQCDAVCAHQKTTSGLAYVAFTSH